MSLLGNPKDKPCTLQKDGGYVSNLMKYKFCSMLKVSTNPKAV